MLRMRDIMTRDVITAPSSMHVHEALKLMRDRHIRRLPVVDDGKLVGIVSRERLERTEPPAGTSMVWELRHLAARSTLKDVMLKDIVVVSPDATMEEGVALAQRNKVGALLVAEGDTLVGIATTNDVFYRVFNPILGIDEPGSRLYIAEGGEGKALEDAIACIHSLEVRIRTLFTIRLPERHLNELLVHVDTEDAKAVSDCLTSKGFQVVVRSR